MVHLLSSESTALVETDEKFIVIAAGAIDIDAVRVVDISRAVY